jgi:oligopeptide/dipeptide ABC transporter ATP-binding protein
MSVLTISDLHKDFRVPGSRAVVKAVNGVSLNVERGETLGLVGESGSGKTTIGRCVLGLERATSGSVQFSGAELTGARRSTLRGLSGRIQIVFQHPYDALNPRMRIGEAIMEPLRAAGRGTLSDRLHRVDELTEMMELDREDLISYPHELSAGRLQRVGIARAMATEPELIVLDEPTSLLDASVRATVIALLARIQRETGVAFIFISHDLTAVRHLSHRVAVMYLGRIVESASTATLFARPLHPYTQALLSAVLLPDPDQVREPHALAGEIPSPVDLPSGCSLRTRCPCAVASCAAAVPTLEPHGPGHEVACTQINTRKATRT